MSFNPFASPRTKKRNSLNTADRDEAKRFLNALNEACKQPAVMATEAATAKPVTPASLDENIRALQERIELLEIQKTSIGNQLKELKAVSIIYRRASLNKVLVGIKADLNIARQRLADYKVQTRQRN